MSRECNFHVKMNNTEPKLCLDSTLSNELASFTMSPIRYGILLVICVLNGVQLIIIRFPSLRTLSNTVLCIWIFSLALIDLLVGLVVQPAFVVYMAGKLKLVFSCDALLTYLFTEIYCVGLSLITLSLIACERFFAILMYPFKKVNEMTKPRLTTVVGVVWAAWFLFNVICRALKVKNDDFFFSPIASVIISLSLIRNAVLYFKIFKIIRRHEREIQAQNRVNMGIGTRDASNLSNTSSSNVQNALTLNTKETHMARTVAYITGVLVLCYSFLMVTSMADTFVEDDALFDHLLYPLAETVTFLNSSLNPFLYCWRRRDLREKNLVCPKGSEVQGHW